MNVILAVSDNALAQADELEASASKKIAEALDEIKQATLVRALHASATSLSAKEAPCG